MAKYTKRFEIDNSGGVAFNREECFYIVPTGRYTCRAVDSFRSATQDIVTYEVKSNHPFIVVVEGYHYHESLDNSSQSEKYVKVVTSGNNIMVE